MQDLTMVARIGVLAVLLPGLLRLMDLRVLMRVLTPAGGATRPATIDVEKAVRLTNLVMGRAPQAHRTCLVRSLVLYRLLRLGGRPVQIHMGVQRAGSRLAGHSWLTCNGQAVAGAPEHNRFSEIYVYPAGPDMAPAWAREEQAPCA